MEERETDLIRESKPTEQVVNLLELVDGPPVGSGPDALQTTALTIAGHIRANDDFSYGPKRQKIATAIARAYAESSQRVDDLVQFINENLRKSGSEYRVSSQVNIEGGVYNITHDPLKLKLTLPASIRLDLRLGGLPAGEADDRLVVSAIRHELVPIHKSKTIPYEMGTRRFRELVEQSKRQEELEQKRN